MSIRDVLSGHGLACHPTHGVGVVLVLDAKPRAQGGVDEEVLTKPRQPPIFPKFARSFVRASKAATSPAAKMPGWLVRSDESTTIPFSTSKPAARANRYYVASFTPQIGQD